MRKLTIAVAGLMMGIVGLAYGDITPPSGGGGIASEVEVTNFPATQRVSLDDKSYSETIVEVTLTDTGLWYSFTLPANTVAYDIKARTGYDFKVSKSSGGKYQTIWAGDTLKRVVTNGTITETLYFNSPDIAGLVMEIRICKRD